MVADTDEDLIPREFYQLPSGQLPADFMLLLGRVLERADSGAKAVERIERRIDGAVEKIEGRLNGVDDTLSQQNVTLAAQNATLAAHTKQLGALGGVIAVQGVIEAAPKIGAAVGVGSGIFALVVWVYGHYSKITGKQ